MGKILIILSFLTCATLFSNLRKDFTDAELIYNKGNLDEFASLLIKLNPSNDTERAFILYYSAILDKDTGEMSAKLEQLIRILPQTYYGQLGYLMLAKNAILERKIADAQSHLRKITHADITERLYWQAFCFFQEGDMNATVTNAENYLRLTPKGNYLEEAHYLIADAYIRQKKYSSAITTLNKLRAIPGYPTDQQYFLYKLGFGYEQQSSIKDALQSYEQGYRINKFSQLAYQIEDRLFEMRSRHGNAVDLAFLYEYTDLPILKELLPETGVAPTVTPTPGSVVIPLELKLPAKPQSGMYIQAGRFSVEQGAIRVANQIRGLSQAGVYYEEMHNNKPSWVVLSGPFNQRADAESARAQLIANGIDCFITNIK